jgi:Uma2 family endonuclease
MVATSSSSTPKPVVQTTVQQSSRSAFPTMHDLPSENPLESGLPDEFHGLQPQLLADTVHLRDYDKSKIFHSFDLNLYYDLEHPGWYKRPDWFLVVGTDRLYRGQSSRSSYVIWDEQIPPVVVIEFLSPSTEDDDLGRFASKPPISQAGKPPGKFMVYEQILQVPNYIVFNKNTNQFRYFRLVAGRYQEQAVAEMNPKIWIPELQIGLGLWEGSYRDLRRGWIRWCDAEGNWLKTEVERERSEKDRISSEKENLRREKENLRKEKEKLANYLRSIGIDPDNLPPSATS